MGLERPDLDDYQNLAKGLPTAGLLLLLVSLRMRLDPGGCGKGFLIGLGVGLVLVAVLVVQMHMWKDQVARAVVEVGNPRLPIGFSLAVVVYFVGLIVAAVAVLRIYGHGDRPEYGVALVIGMIAGALLPWVILNWPMNRIREEANALYWKRDRQRSSAGRPGKGTPPGKK